MQTCKGINTGKGVRNGPLFFFGIKADKINTAYANNSIERNATRSNLKRPMSPQFTAPIMDKVRAVQSSAVFFMAVYLLIHHKYGTETDEIYMNLIAFSKKLCYITETCVEI